MWPPKTQMRRYSSRAWSATFWAFSLSLSCCHPKAIALSNAISVVGVAIRDTAPDRMLDDRRIHARGGVVKGLARDEHHHEIGAARQRVPILLGSETVDMLADMSHMPFQSRLAGLFVLSSLEGLQIAIERRLGVDDCGFASREPNDYVGPQLPILTLD